MASVRLSAEYVGQAGSTGVYRIDLSQSGLNTIQSITFLDDNVRSGGSGGASGLDLDFLKLSETHTTSASNAADTIVGENAFNFSTSGVAYYPGFLRQWSPADDEHWNVSYLFGTDYNSYDPTVPTLGIRDGRESASVGALSLGEGGQATFFLTSAVTTGADGVANAKYLYFGDSGGNDLSFVSVSDEPLAPAHSNDVSQLGTPGDDYIALGRDMNAHLGAGNDFIDGKDGNDTLLSSGANDQLMGGAGNDLLYGEAGNDTLLGETGNDHLYGGAGDDWLDGGSENDWLEGGTGNDTQLGGKGDDYLGGGDANDKLYGQAGFDSLYGGAGNDWLDGGTENDWLDGGSGNDTIYGGSERDALFGQAGNDRLHGGTGNDRLYGGLGNDLLYGDSGVDKLYGDAGNDKLYGGAGIDYLYGGSGNDKLYGGAGNDKLWGGSGKDAFVLDSKPHKTQNVDRIYDFNVKYDSIYLENSYFKVGKGTAAKPHKINSDMFTIGKHAADAEDRIIYDKSSGALYYDPDGTGAKAQIKIAVLQKNLKLTYHDFFAI